METTREAAAPLVVVRFFGPCPVFFLVPLGIYTGY